MKQYLAKLGKEYVVVGVASEHSIKPKVIKTVDKLLLINQFIAGMDMNDSILKTNSFKKIFSPLLIYSKYVTYLNSNYTIDF
jgi:hypothetical protein